MFTRKFVRSWFRALASCRRVYLGILVLPLVGWTLLGGGGRRGSGDLEFRPGTLERG